MLGFWAKLIGGHNKCRIRARIGYIDHPQISPGPRLSDGNTCTFGPKTVFHRARKYIFDFLFGDAVLLDMRLAGFRVHVETGFHRSDPLHAL